MKNKLIKSIVVSLFILLLLVSGGACANSQAAQVPATTPPSSQSAPATQPPGTAQTLSLGSKQAGNLSVSLSSSPNPPIRGNNIFEALVTDAQGQPVSDAKLSFDIDMTNMSHGKKVIAASSLSNGRYSGNLYFLMPGPWRVIISIERAGQTNTARFDFNVNWR